MAQLLRALAALPEDWSSVLSTHGRWLTTPCYSSPRRSNSLCWPVHSPTHAWHTLTQIQIYEVNTYIFRSMMFSSLYAWGNFPLSQLSIVFFFREELKSANSAWWHRPVMLGLGRWMNMEGWGIWAYLQLHRKFKTSLTTQVPVSNKKSQQLLKLEIWSL